MSGAYVSNMNKTTKPQIARCFEIFQEFDFEVKYRPGTRMAQVDGLSRAVSNNALDDPSKETILT